MHAFVLVLYAKKITNRLRDLLCRLEAIGQQMKVGSRNASLDFIHV